jgi:GT2 family glycosyltransferase
MSRKNKREILGDLDGQNSSDDKLARADVHNSSSRIELAILSDTGLVFIAGACSATAAIAAIELRAAAAACRIGSRHIGTARAGGKASAAFWTAGQLGPDLLGEEAATITVFFGDGSTVAAEMRFERHDASAFRDAVKRHLAELPGEEKAHPSDATIMERIMSPPPAIVRPVPRYTIENISIAECGLFVTGWINDTADDLAEIRVNTGTWSVTLAGDGLARASRDDVQVALAIPRRHAFGFWGMIVDPAIDTASATCVCEMVMKGGGVERQELPLNILFDQIELRNLALTYLATSKYLGNPMLDSVASLEKHIGKQIVDLNVLISRAITARPHVERFGSQSAKKGSIIVCLYGRAEYLTLQNALFANRKGIGDYEFVYVSNSPELAEQLARDAHVASVAYGLDLTLVLLPGNAGFGAANNAAVNVSRTKRPLIVNPDVFPFDLDWAARHTALVENAPDLQTRLFGAPLYYDDGSLMHGGMYFDSDASLSIEGASFRRNVTLRVEHYGKGAPPDSAEFLRPRPVPAVTGAFISADRGWYEKLGGFSEEYVLGHYEDADLCLKSTEKGVVPWLHDIKLWHLEGKGSGARQAAHEGASIVNRWLFNRRWIGTIIPEMLGARPRHPLLQVAPLAGPVRPAPAPMPATAPGRPVAPVLRRPPVAAGPVAARPAPRNKAPAAPSLQRGLTEIVFGAES